MIKELIKLSNHLDKLGFTKEADYLDALIKQASEEEGELPIHVYQLSSGLEVHITDDPEGYLEYERWYVAEPGFLAYRFEDFDSAMENYEFEMNPYGEPYIVKDFRNPKAKLREAHRLRDEKIRAELVERGRSPEELPHRDYDDPTDSRQEAEPIPFPGGEEFEDLQ